MYKIIELERSNVTVAQFFSYVRSKCREKGIEFGINKGSFENPETIDIVGYYVDENKGIAVSVPDKKEWCKASEAPARIEIVASAPYSFKEYFRGWDNSFYNEICEFTFDKESIGHGYYYKVESD